MTVLADVNLSEVSFSRDQQDLVLSGYNDGDSIRIQYYFGGNTYKVEQFVFQDTTLTNPDIANAIRGANLMVHAMSAFGASNSASATGWQTNDLSAVQSLLFSASAIK